MDMFTGRACDRVEDDCVFRRVGELIDRRRWPGRREGACARARGGLVRPHRAEPRGGACARARGGPAATWT